MSEAQGKNFSHLNISSQYQISHSVVKAISSDIDAKKPRNQSCLKDQEGTVQAVLRVFHSVCKQV
jgi:hypothetical protein